MSVMDPGKHCGSTGAVMLYDELGHRGSRVDDGIKHRDKVF